MTHDKLLEVEYKEQYNQYRWIGQMQGLVLIFYGAVAAFGLRASANTAGALVGVGLLGIFTGFALLNSRLMQMRTARYLVELLCQIGEGVDSWALDKTALRYRALCGTSGHFSLLDTMNTGFLIAFFSGGALFIYGGVILIPKQGWLASNGDRWWAGVVTLLLVIWAFREVQHYFRKEKDQMKTDHSNAPNAPRGLGYMRKAFGLP